MTTVKVIILGVIFILTSGSVFSGYFRENRKVSFLAGVVAVIASSYLIADIYSDIKNEVSHENSRLEREIEELKEMINIRLSKADEKDIVSNIDQDNHIKEKSDTSEKEGGLLSEKEERIENVVIKQQKESFVAISDDLDFPTEGYSIKLITTTDRAAAFRAFQIMVDGGYPAYIQPSLIGNKTVYSVKLGSYSERAEAKEIQARMKRRYINSSMIQNSVIEMNK